MKGANGVLGIDIDQWATENALENIRLNDTPSIAIKTGGAELLTEEAAFDIIFANINRNILLADMAAYVACLHEGSHLFMSGFYESDIPVIREAAENLGLRWIGFREKNHWVAVHFVR